MILRLRVVGRWKDKGIRKVEESAIIKKKKKRVNVKKKL